MPQHVSIAGGGLRATISGLGAELRRLDTDSGLELLWNGDPAVWAGRSPLLFPVVGNLKNDRVLIGGTYHPMSRHGFARTSTFALVTSEPSRCTWRLVPNADTRMRYPFDFQLDVTYALASDGLSITATVTNNGSEPMPASFGFHPAFRWPLLPGSPREAHEIHFAKPEPAPIRRLANGLLADQTLPTPVVGRRLALADSLFAGDALIFDQPRSRQVTYGAPGGPTLTVDFPAMPHLGIWSRPGAGFVCIEPWHGFVSPEHFDGELRDKPGIVLLRPRDSRSFAIRVSVQERT